jgi:hypothetical protein
MAPPHLPLRGGINTDHHSERPLDGERPVDPDGS